MTPVKATLTVILKANEVVVAEIDDAALWQKVLTAINNGNSDLGSQPNRTANSFVSGKDDADDPELQSLGNTPVTKFAQQLGIHPDLVVGGCSPSIESPYIHLDAHCWEEMKKQLPARGATAVAPIVASATLLALWFNATGLGNPTQAQAKEVLGTINLNDTNASRSIQNADWLQGRAGGQIILNPAQISKSVKLAKCFCSKDWAAWKGTAGS